MRGRILIAAVAIGLALAGCTALSPRGHMSEPSKTKTPCHPGACEVPVTMAWEGSTCVVLPLDDIAVSGQSVNITWKLADSPDGFTFDENGVYIKPKADPDGQFSRVTEPGSRKKFILHDKNSVPGNGDRYYPYAIQVVHGTTRCTLYDPWIINQR